MWNLLAPLLVGAVAGKVKQHQQKQAKKGHDKQRRNVMRYSPWTGMKPEAEMQVQDDASALLGGGLSGLAWSNFLGKNADTLAKGGSPIADFLDVSKWFTGTTLPKDFQAVNRGQNAMSAGPQAMRPHTGY